MFVKGGDRVEQTPGNPASHEKGPTPGGSKKIRGLNPEEAAKKVILVGKERKKTGKATVFEGRRLTTSSGDSRALLRDRHNLWARGPSHWGQRLAPEEISLTEGGP